MKIKEVQAGVKVSKDYNSYSFSLIADIENTENPEKVGEILIEKALKVINKKIGKSLKESFEEVGAAWLSKDSKDKLSVQYSKEGVWKDVEIRDLEEEGGEYIQKIGSEKFFFKRIPEEKRKNAKMPMFRIYKKEVENDERKNL